MNNKTILLLNSAFASSEELWRSWRMLSSTANTLLDLHNSSDDTQPHLTIVNYVNNGNRTEWSAIWSEVIYMILKSEFESQSQVRFPANHNCMKQSSILLLYY